jgi:hypothetical protein
MKDSEVVMTIDFNEVIKRQLDAICALMEHESNLQSLEWSIAMGEEIAKKHARGGTSVHCLTPALGDLITTHPEFFEALCEEGVVEWITPLVMRKTAERG